MPKDYSTASDSELEYVFTRQMKSLADDLTEDQQEQLADIIEMIEESMRRKLS